MEGEDSPTSQGEISKLEVRNPKQIQKSKNQSFKKNPKNPVNPVKTLISAPLRLKTSDRTA
jgi:hypothetical protein